MKNIWHIFTSDLKRLIKSPLAFIIAGGLCVLPSLYAWFNIYSNWDPYANTGNIKIAVVSEDKGFVEESGEKVNMGDEVAEELKENESIGWIILSSKQDALDGVYSGEYYAAVIIGEDFSYNMYNVFEDNFSGPTIYYYENEKRNAVATKITDTAVSTLKKNINSKSIEVATKTIFTETNQLSSDMKEENAVENFEEKLTTLNNNLIAYSQMIDTFIQANAVLTSEVSKANDEVPELQRKISNGAASFNNAKDSLSKTQTSLNDFSQNVTQTMDGIKNSINNVSADINNAKLAENAQNTANCLKTTLNDTETLIRQLNELKGSLNGSIGENGTEQVQQDIQDIQNIQDMNIQDVQDIQDVLNTLETLKNGAEQIKQQIESSGIIGSLGSTDDAVAGIVNNSVSNMNATLTACSQSVDNMKNIYVNSLVPQLDSLLNGMTKMLDNVTTLLSNLNSSVGDMGVIFEGIETTVDQTSNSLEQIQTVIESVSEKLTDLLERLDGASDDEKVQMLVEFLQGDPERYGEFFAQPVLVTTEEVYPIKNYGSAMTPFYSVLALWVGGTILVALIKVHAEPKDLTNVKPYQLFFGRYLLFFVMGQLQAAIIVLGDIYLLGCQVMYPFWFWVAAAIASFTFTLLIYSLALAFGDVGKAAAVVVMVIQIAGSGGTFPIELLPEVYRNIYIFFPFPYAINAIRETIGGMYGSDYMKYLAELLIFAVVGLLIGLVIRLPFMRMNHFVEKRMEDTKLM